MQEITPSGSFKRREMVDGYRHKGRREELVKLLRTKGITDENVLSAIGTIPRHFFLDSAFDHIAYEDRAFPIAAEQTISQPYTVAYQTQLLKIKPGQKVLEIGTGSMYQTAVLSAVGAKVYTIERQKQLFDLIPYFEHIKQYKHIHFFFGDGFEGLPDLAPFDRILITAAAPKIPEKLWAQLKVNGKMVIPLDMEDGTAQRMLRITKKKDGQEKRESFEEFSFVPMLEGKTSK
jgi:protein-L-isoaspartate(D-aspartate) O-methyltransferase